MSEQGCTFVLSDCHHQRPCLAQYHTNWYCGQPEAAHESMHTPPDGCPFCLPLGHPYQEAT